MTITEAATEPEEDDFYCVCDLETTEDEHACNRCGCCGKLLE